MVQCRGVKSSPYPLSSSLDALRIGFHITNVVGYHDPEVVLLVGNVLDAVDRNLLVCNRVELWNQFSTRS